MIAGEPATAGDDVVEIALDAVQADGAAGVGRVVRAGVRAAGLVDRRVLIGPSDPCGECDVCRRGGAAVCPLARRRDAIGDTVTAAARWLVPLGDGLELPLPAAAAIAGDVATAYTLYARTGPGPREPVVVIGASPIGRFLIEILIAKGLQPAVVSFDAAWTDWLRHKRVAVAEDRAALIAVLAGNDHGGKPWRMICADPAACASAVELAGPRASLTALAGRGTAPISGNALRRELTITGVAGPHPDLVVETAAMCMKGEIDLVDGTSLASDRLRTHVRTVR